MASSISSIPNEYICPITHEIMNNPVILIEDGCSYEESALQSWLQNHNTSPMTNNVLINRNYTPNRALKSLISDFLSRQQTLSRDLHQEFLAFNIRGGSINPDWKYRPTIRIRLTLLGSTGVGKTVLAQSLQYGKWPKFMTFPTTTIGNDILFYHLDQLFRNEYAVVIQLDDPSGQERFEAVTNYFFRRCHGALLLTDSTDLETLNRLERYWYSKLQTLGLDNVQSVLVCTKIDLFEKQDKDYRDLFLQRAEEFAFVQHIPIVHVSACRGDNVEHVFKQLIIRILTNEILIKDLLAQANSPNDLIIRRHQTFSSENSASVEHEDHYDLQRKKKKKEWKCCK